MSLVGEKGKKYGLIVKQSSKLEKIFGGDDDDENMPTTGVASKQMQKKNEIIAQKALEIDSSVYDYDGHYDQMQQARKEAVQAKKGAPKQSKYIGSLLEQAEVRDREYEKSMDRLIQKEQEKEAALYGDKEKFITPAYKQLLMEREKWDKEQAARDAEDEKRAKTSDGMAGFLKNMLDQRDSLDSAIREKLDEKSKKPSSQSQEGEKKFDGQKMGLNVMSKVKDEPRSPARVFGGGGDNASSPRRGENSDEEERGRKRRHDSQSPEPMLRRVKEEREEDSAERGPKLVAGLNLPVKKEVKQELLTEEEKQRAREEEVRRKWARRNDDDSVQAARDRFLRRKEERNRSGMRF